MDDPKHPETGPVPPRYEKPVRTPGWLTAAGSIVAVALLIIGVLVVESMIG